MANKNVPAITFGPLTFEIETLDRSEEVVQYGIKVFREGEVRPFKIAFAAHQKASLEDIAKSVLYDLWLSTDNPEAQWARLVAEMDKISFISGVPTPPDILAMIRQTFNQMASWASERPDSINDAAAAAGLEKQ